VQGQYGGKVEWARENALNCKCEFKKLRLKTVTNVLQKQTHKSKKAAHGGMGENPLMGVAKDRRGGKKRGDQERGRECESYLGSRVGHGKNDLGKKERWKIRRGVFSRKKNFWGENPSRTKKKAKTGNCDDLTGSSSGVVCKGHSVTEKKKSIGRRFNTVLKKKKRGGEKG